MPDGRIMVPSTPATRGEVDVVEDTKEVFAGPDGRFYVRSEDAKSEKARTSDAVDQAGLFAGQPPTKEEIKVARSEQKAAEKAAASPTAEPETPADPAAETVTDEPVEAASDAAGDPPPETVGEQPAANASRDAWADYARTRGATDDDLVDADGNPLRRNDIRDKYQLL